MHVSMSEDCGLILIAGSLPINLLSKELCLEQYQ